MMEQAQAETALEVGGAFSPTEQYPIKQADISVRGRFIAVAEFSNNLKTDANFNDEKVADEKRRSCFSRPEKALQSKKGLNFKTSLPQPTLCCVPFWVFVREMHKINCNDASC